MILVSYQTFGVVHDSEHDSPKALKVAMPFRVSRKCVLNEHISTDRLPLDHGEKVNILQRTFSLKVKQPKLSRSPQIETLQDI
jgi:hypothetical protein